MWLIIVLTVSVFVTAYVGWRVIVPMSRRTGVRMAAWILLGALLIGPPMIRLLRDKGVPQSLLDAVQWADYIGLGFISFVVVFLLFKDTALLLRTLTRKLRPKKPAQRKIFFKNHDPERRRLLINTANAFIVAGAAPLTAYSVFEARRMPEVVRVNHPLPNLPADLNGLTIAQLSDTHIGPTIKGDWLARCVDEVNKLTPDMIVHTGDLIDGHASWLRPDVAPLADLKAPLGKFFCTGNHEYYSGVRSWLREVEHVGFQPLVDEHQLVQRGNGRLLMAGVADLRARHIEPSHESSPQKAMASAPAHHASILLAHRPKSVFEARKTGVNIQLSGHTHGGQFFPWTHVIHYFQPYVRGLHLVDNTRLYVNVGTGYWGPPLRLGTIPEITLHTLTRA
ncbi:metallophosphoesterase [Pseudodesulfovibrio senegalensis]|uniref:Metallophosphoesterase n=1 Tax=Pseudodesulfovibrio senegalensis TaxID=1721087 RepID=A0A6N6N4W5_9BACT|nr:metallophosphoesterase [Pseudodesulfovibrio senegalensis]KAB1443096.1 metallophosphoesterase [Pseudodesulfovibrio senegalensis]